MSEAFEYAESQLNAFVERQAARVKEARAGQERQNALEAMWAASERAHARKQREENRADWIRHYRGLARAHHDLAAINAQRADELEHDARGDAA